MKVQHATFDDVVEIVSLGEQMHEESPRFRRHPYRAEKLFQLAYNTIDSEDGIALIARDEADAICGMMIGFVVEFFFSDARYSTDLVWYVRPDCRGTSLAVRLVKQFEEEARARGAAEHAPGVSTGVEPERTVKLYAALGYETVGANMMKVL